MEDLYGRRCIQDPNSDKYFVLADDDFRQWQVDITEETIRYHMEHLVTERIAHITAIMATEGFETIFTKNVTRKEYRNLGGEAQRATILGFARPGTWRLLSEADARAEFSA